MKTSNYCILALSLYSYMFAIVVGIAEIAGVLRSDYLGVGMIALAVAQAIIALIVVTTGREKKK